MPPVSSPREPRPVGAWTDTSKGSVPKPTGNELLKRRILIERGRIGNYRLYRISPYIAFHGTGIEQREAIKTCNPPDIPGFDNTTPSLWEVQ